MKTIILNPCFWLCGITPDSRVFQFINIMEIIYCPKCGCKEYTIHEVPPHRQARCKDCGAYIKNLQQDDLTFWFGKYKGCKLSGMKSIEETKWLHWAYQNATTLKQHQRVLIAKHLGL